MLGRRLNLEKLTETPSLTYNQLLDSFVPLYHCFSFLTMADVRSLLKNERAARRIQHKHASYSTTGTLLCTVCHLQLKSESLWEGHLRSAGHIMRAQTHAEDQESKTSSPAETPANGNGNGSKRKRNASADEDEPEATLRKRTKSIRPGLPDGFFDSYHSSSESPHSHLEMQIPSRPATPLKTPELRTPEPAPTKKAEPEPDVDENEWAAFESDIATAEAQVKAANDAVIMAPAMSAADLKKKSQEEEYNTKKERAEAEAEGDKEDAARKMEEELEEMHSLEERVRKMRERREELRKKESMIDLSKAKVAILPPATIEGDDEDDEEEDEEWDGFRMKV